MSIDLSVEFCGIRYKNPFLLASTPASRTEKWTEMARAGWAGGVTWAGSSFLGGPPVIILYPGSGLPTIGRKLPAWSCQVGAVMSVAQHKKESLAFGEALKQDPELVRQCTKEAKEAGLPVTVNLLYGDNVSLWAQGAMAAEMGGADLLELNLSCPAPLMGFDVSKDLHKTTEIVKAIRGSTRLPIMAKIHACLMEDELKRLAVAVVEAGASAISTTNLFYGIVGVDIETGMPIGTERDIFGNPRAGVASFSGPSIKPFGLKAVAQIASEVDVPISGIGGVTNWQSAVEYMMLGASTVQVGMAAMLFGYDMVNEMISGLSGFMERKGYRSPHDFIGIAFKNVPGLGEHVTAPVKLVRRYVVDDKICNGCGLCIKTCSASNNGAMQLTNGVACIDESLCNLCGMCKIVCSTKAILVEEAG